MRCWQLAVYLLSYLWPTLNHSFGFRSSYELRRTGFSHAHEGLIQDTGKLFFSTRLHHWHTDLETAWAIQILPCIEREKKEKEGEKPQQTDFIWQWWKSAPSQVLSNDVYTVGFNCEKLLCEAAVTLANESGRGSCTGNRDPPVHFLFFLSLLRYLSNSQCHSLSILFPLLLQFPFLVLLSGTINKLGVSVVKLWKN